MMFFGPYFMFLMGLSQLIIKKRERESYIYMSSYILMGLWVFQISLYTTHALPGSIIMSYIIMPLNILASLIMLLRYKIIVQGALIIEKWFMFLFILPVLAVAIAVLPFLMGYDFSSEYFIFRTITDPTFDSMPAVFRLIHYLNVFPKFFLVTTTAIMLATNTGIWKLPDTVKTKISRLGFIFGIVMIILTFLTGIGDIISFEICKWSVVMINADYFTIFLIGQYHPDFSRVIKIFMTGGRYEHSKIKGLDIEKILSDIKIMMEEEKAFAVEGINLKLVADELNITTQQLSQILNEKLNKSFNNFINGYRIKEAKKLLIEEPDRTIMSIALAVGFNSNTTFSTTFSCHCGMTPKAYRNSHLRPKFPGEE